MNTAFTVGDVLLISGAIISMLLTCVGLLLGHVFKGLNDKLRELRQSDHDIRGMLQALPSQFLPRREYEISERTMSRAIEELKTELHDGFERLYDKLETRR